MIQWGVGRAGLAVSHVAGLGICLAACTHAGSGAIATPVAPDPIPLLPPPVRHYVAVRTAVPPRVDGRLDDPAWAASLWSTPFVDIGGDRGATPSLETRMRLLWDDSSLYVAAVLEEPDLWATLRTRDTVIYLENDFELFLDPDGDTHHYYELEINALGTVWDLLLEKPYRDGGRAVNALGHRRAAIRGAPRGYPQRSHRSGRRLDRRTGNPLGLPCHRSARGLGDRWRINFSRVEWTRDTWAAPIASAWTPSPIGRWPRPTGSGLPRGR